MADRDVRVNLKLEASGNAPAALKDAAASAEKASVAAAKFTTEAKQLDGAKAAAVARGYNDTASAAAKATAEAKRFNAEQSGMKAGIVPGRGNAPQMNAPQMPAMKPAGGAAAAPAGGIASQFGLDPGMMAAAGPAFVAIQALAKGLGVAAKAADAYSDETLTNAQKMKKVGESIPVIGEVYKSFNELADALSGKSEIIRRASREEAKYTVKASSEIAEFQQSLPLQNQMAVNDARAKAAKETSLVEFTPPDRSTLQGDLDYQRYERKAPLEMDKRRAEIELKAAQAGVGFATGQVDDLQSKRAAAQKARENAEQMLAEQKAIMDKGAGNGDPDKRQRDKTWLNVLAGTGGPVGGFLAGQGVNASFESTGTLKAAADAKEAISEELKIRQQLVTAQQAQAESVKALAKAESDVRKANIALAKEELAVLKERENQVKQSAQSFGSLSAVDKQAALEAAAAFQQKGYDALTPEAKAAIQAAGGGQVLQFAAQQSAQNDPKFQQSQALLGLESDLKGIQQKQVEIAAQVQVDVQVDEVQVAEQLKTALKPIFDDLVHQFSLIAKALQKQVEVGQVAGAAQQ